MVRSTVNLLWYLWQIYRALPGSWKQKKEILSRMERSIRDYLSDGTYVSYTKLKERFGDPKQVSAEYVSALEVEEILSHLETGRKSVRAILIAMMAAIFLWGGYFAAYRLASAFQSAQVFLDDDTYIMEQSKRTYSRSSGHITGSKIYARDDGGEQPAWIAELTGTVAYSGLDAAFSACDVDVDIYNTSWYIVSKSSEKRGDCVTATVTMGYKRMGITIRKIPVKLILSCDANGNLS